MAAGRGALQRLFPRNAERSVYDKPQRNLAMIVVKGPSMQAPDIALAEAAIGAGLTGALLLSTLARISPPNQAILTSENNVARSVDEP